MSAPIPPFGPPSFTPADAAFEQRVRASFARQRVMTTLGASLVTVAPGEIVIALPFKVNFLAPAAGHRFLAYGRVTKPGRTLTVTTGDVVAETDAGPKPVATMLATMMTARGRDIAG